MRPIVPAIAALTAAVLAVCGASAADAAPATASSLATAPVAAASTSGTSRTGNGWTVTQDESTTSITWDAKGSLPTGDARPEFHVNGRVIGVPVPTKDKKALTLTLPGAVEATPQNLSVVASGRRLDAAGGAPAVQRVYTLPTPAKTVVADPARAGKYKYKTWEYTLPSISITGLSAKVEMVARVVVPTNAPGKRPLVLFLHGRHSTCYAGQWETSIDWPCSGGMKSIPSYRGYTYIQNRLASQGYATVSISANGINGQDGWIDDAGMTARSRLVDQHLRVLAAWAKGGGTAAGRWLKGRIDTSRTVLVGHSRGGEGVNLAASTVAYSAPYRVVGQVLIAPTDFAAQVAPGVDTTVLLPYCDGDVSDLQGQGYVDRGRSMFTGDGAMRSAVMIFGANHNYFNSEWTPGVAAAPADDDWWSTSDRVCGMQAAARLSAKEQRAAGATYVSAAVRAYLGRDASALKLIDGSPVRAQNSPAVVRTESLGGQRRSLYYASSAAAITTGGAMRAARCSGSSSSKIACSTSSDESNAPHWLAFAQSSATVGKAVRMSWTKAGSWARMPVPGVRSVKGLKTVDLRVIVEPAKGVPAFDVVLRDAAGHRLVLTKQSTAAPLPAASGSGKYWAQTVRATLPATAKGFDLKRIASVDVVARSPRGKIYVLDAVAGRPGLSTAKVRPWQVVRASAPTATAVAGKTASGTRVVDVKIPVSGRSKYTAYFYVSYWGYNADGSGREIARRMAVAPGQTSLTVPITIVADGVYAAGTIDYPILVVPAANATTVRAYGSLSTTATAARPTLTATRTDLTVKAGTPARWTLKVSAPIRDLYQASLVAVAPTTGVELTSGGVPADWLSEQPKDVDIDYPLPLSKIGLQQWTLFDRTTLTRTIEVPTTATAAADGPRVITLEIQADDLLVIEPIRLTATVVAP